MADAPDTWTFSSEPVSPTDPVRLPALVRRALLFPRFLSIGSTDNTVEVRMSRELYEQIAAIVGPKTFVPPWSDAQHQTPFPEGGGNR